MHAYVAYSCRRRSALLAWTEPGDDASRGSACGQHTRLVAKICSWTWVMQPRQVQFAIASGRAKCRDRIEGLMSLWLMPRRPRYGDRVRCQSRVQCRKMKRDSGTTRVRLYAVLGTALYAAACGSLPQSWRARCRIVCRGRVLRCYCDAGAILVRFWCDATAMLMRCWCDATAKLLQRVALGASLSPTAVSIKGPLRRDDHARAGMGDRTRRRQRVTWSAWSPRLSKRCGG